jgi:3D (Asp-Asp-Asp) domain-containing protein
MASSDEPCTFSNSGSRDSFWALLSARMLRFVVRAGLPAAALILGACSSRPLPKYEKPIARTHFQQVRTTAYTHSEADHRQHGRSTAMGGTLQSANVRAQAADWSRWPAGTMFRIVETGELYRVDDYGWALAGTNTIDLYKPSRAAMNSWGVRRVTIENIEWGDVDRSLAILKPRSKYRHVRRMIDQIEDRYAELHRPGRGPANRGSAGNAHSADGAHGSCS